MKPEGVKGRGWGKFVPGPQITNIQDLKMGETYLVYSTQFNAKNVVMIVQPPMDWYKHPDNDIRYGAFITEDGRLEGVFAIWDFHLESDKYYHKERSHV